MHKALRSFKVTGNNGQTRIVKPGDAVPEAATWKNPEVWVRRRWITDANGNTYDGRHFVTGKTRTVDVVNVQGPPPAAKPAGRVGPMRAGSRPEPAGDVGPTSPEPAAPATTAPDAAKCYEGAELKRMTKADVVTVAESMGLAVDGTKDDIIDSILEAQNG